MAGLLENLTSTFEAYNPIFQDISRPVADVLGLKNLGPHFDVFVYSFILFNVANIVLVPGLSRLFFNRIYGALDAKTKSKWYVIFPPPPPLSTGFGNHRRGHVFPFLVDIPSTFGSRFVSGG